jgi:hypothetical protein
VLARRVLRARRGRGARRQRGRQVVSDSRLLWT